MDVKIYLDLAEPTWIQGAQIPQCQICGCKMSFLMQLDSQLPDTNGGELYFGSGGILYVLVRRSVKRAHISRNARDTPTQI